jgi:ABC-2 type transport system permease protein
MAGGTSLLAVFLRRDWAIARSYRLNFALDLFQIVVSLVMFFYLSRLVDDSELASASQLDEGYFAFVVVGLAFMKFMETGLTAFALQLRTDQTTGTLEALLVTPARQSLVVLGSATYELLLSAVSGALMLAIAITFFGLDLSVSFTSLLVLIAAIPASFGLFAAIGVMFAAFTVVFKQVATLIAFAATGIAVLAGVYFPLSLLPGWLEAIARAFPFSWALDVLRAALLGGDPSVGKLLLLIAACAVAVPISVAVFAAAVDRAKRTGTLAQY